MKLKEIKPNPDNPRYINEENFSKLKKSIKGFERMMELRPMVIDESNTVLGGNMRLRALEELGYKDIPDEWVKRAEDLTEEQKREFIIKDNVGFGSWDWDTLANEWDSEELNDWGLNTPDADQGKEQSIAKTDGELQFSEELLLEHNYIVLYFDNALDWEVAKEKYGVKQVKTRAPEKSSKVGLGRVVNGKNYI
jgi:hypothetical protein